MSSFTVRIQTPAAAFRRALSSLAVLALLLSSAGIHAAPPSGFAAAQTLLPIAENVYLDSRLPAETTTRLIHLVDEAKAQASRFYGQLTANPSIVICSSMDGFKKSGGVGLGYSDGSNILISPYGGRVAIISHELSHVELASRIGGFSQVLAKIPQWFDEGLAVFMSQAEEFSEEAWLKATDNGKNAPRLSELETLTDWNRITGEDGANMQLSYGTAKHEVARWYAKVGQEGLAQLIDALNHDQDFFEAYRSIENHTNNSSDILVANLF